MSHQKDNSRAQFATRLGVIAATVGSSVGLGNIWRFPYEAGAHGGGAFLICYLCFILILGIPVICAEFIMGRGSRSNIFGAFRKFCPTGYWHYTGYIGIIASMMILSFYSVVAGWTMEYCWGAVTGAYNGSTQDEFHNLFAEFITGWRPTMWTLIFLFINYKVMMGGVTKGIERISNILMPALFVILIAFCVNSLMLPEAKKGVAFLFRPDFSQIKSTTMISAMGQAFFSLSIGLGTMMTYASYFNSRTPLLKTAGIIAGLDTLVALVSGLIIFPAVFTFGMASDEGPTLVFEVLPTIFHQMPGGVVWAFMFFFLLFVASLTSTISMSEISIAFLQEEKKMTRASATRLSIGSVSIFAVLCALSFGPLSHIQIFGKNIFDIFNYVSSDILLPVGGLLTSAFVGWKLDRGVIRQQLTGLKRWAVSLIIFLLKWIAPACILLVFLNKIGVI